MSWTSVDEHAVAELVGGLNIDKDTVVKAYALIHRILHQAQKTDTKDRGQSLARGDLLVGIEELGQGCGLSRQMTRNLIEKHLDGPFLTRSATNKYTVLHVVNFDTYVPAGQSSNQLPTSNQPATNQQPPSPPLQSPYRVGAKELEEEVELPSGELDSPPAPTNGVTSKQKLERLCTKYPEVPLILKDNWLAHHPLPASSQTPSAKLRIADTIRLLHTADEYPWPVIASIVEYAAKEWAPKGMIGSPASLREWTKKHDRKTHEAIVEQMNSTDTADDELSTLRKDILG